MNDTTVAAATTTAAGGEGGGAMPAEIKMKYLENSAYLFGFCLPPLPPTDHSQITLSI